MAPQLDSAITLPCGAALRNRIMKSALSEGLADAFGAPDIRLTRLYSRWATIGGFGLLVTGNVMVDRQHLGEPGNVVADERSDLAAFARWASAMRGTGTAMWMQINHPGRQANPIAGVRPVAPSAIPTGIPGMATPRELSAREIADIIQKFATAAVIAAESGFDGVQIHAAHGYLISQFLSPNSNRREDEWGGSSIENRSRFLLEILRAIRRETAGRAGFAVGVKINSADFQRGGFSEDDFRCVARLLESDGIDMLEISGGTYESPAMTGRAPELTASTMAREAYFLEFAEAVRRETQASPIAVTGGFRTRAGMSDAISSGACDIVGVGRPSATTPDAATRILNGSADLTTRAVTFGLPSTLARKQSIRALEGALELQWHTDQLHRIAAGAEPDLRRSIVRTAGSAIQRNGLGALQGRGRRR
ncbi:NADH:flavin oxidoreductase/NADH oxidase family protein [Gordonia sp. OPL2]|uniref:NADH:flavin oxidoreductase/NADH oxidase family protein n=1 Tax=Gordonia sp. OPL2 TaxID=2486274 RepID=UPI0021CCE4A2|nr:NADH:flavin oxidoreductase/NADH oxidase family protein [Gordonia sp. OPL2]